MPENKKINFHTKRGHNVPKKTIPQQLTPRYTLVKLLGFQEKGKKIGDIQTKRPGHT